MKYKAALHNHSAEDVYEGRVLDYSLFDLIDRALDLNYKILASTCHLKNIVKPEHVAYARVRGMLLFSGVELELEEDGRVGHVLVINPYPECENFKNFSDLIDYRHKHADSIIIAAHPNFGFGASMGLKLLKKYIKIFDAVEYSWFYNYYFNLNTASFEISKNNGKKMLSAADLHSFNKFALETDFCELEAENLNQEAVIKALKNGQWENHTQSKSWLILAKSFYLLMMSMVKLRLFKA